MSILNHFMEWHRSTRPDEIYIVNDRDLPGDPRVSLRIFDLSSKTFWMIRASFWLKFLHEQRSYAQPKERDFLLGTPVYDRTSELICRDIAIATPPHETRSSPSPTPPHELIKAILLEEHKVGIMRADRLVKAFPSQVLQAIMHNQLRAGALALLMKENEEYSNVANNT